jgi:hypothetical protein
MNTTAFRTLAALSLTVLLAACGSGSQIDQPDRTAASIQTDVAAQVALAPVADCAADGCKSLRIIDANAETYRYDAMRRAEAPQS